MTISAELKAAFSFHMRGTIRRPYGDNRPRAVLAMEHARRDVAEGKRRYPAGLRDGSGVAWQKEKGMCYVDKPEHAGLRLVGRVVADCGGRNGIWDNRESSGWFTDPHGDTFRDGTGLCWGVVYQLPGRNGESRFVAGYQFGGCDGGPTLDLSHIYTESKYERWGSDTSPTNMDSARDAASAADSMAERAAEEEREYQTAWAAGNQYSIAADESESFKAEIRDILAERRRVKGQDAYPALCSAIKARVTDLLADLKECRDRMQRLREGDESELYFYPGDSRLADAFNEGAGCRVI